VKSEVRSPSTLRSAAAEDGKSEGSPKTEVRTVLVCFALKEEARPFERLVAGRRDVKVILVGMGKRNAERAIRAALVEERPALVLTSGSAGGLRPDLTLGTVVFDAGPETRLEPALQGAGAKPVRFYCSERVAATVAEKRALRESTGADAVEMESEPIRAVCREQKIPSATVRVILDTAEEDLPLDFSELLTAEQKLSYVKLALALLKAPGKVGALLQLRRQSQAAAEKLGQTLAGLL
jgi:adenosylhomocysteine nucleosidase